MPAVPDWQKMEQAQPRLAGWSNVPQKLDQGNPLSVLPESVQESLLAGHVVALDDIVRTTRR